jgi:hypothetical protein
MPIILPPAFEVPAIIRVASHAPAAHPASPTTRGTAVPTNPGPQPLDTGQNPEIVTPPTARVLPPPPPSTTTTTSSDSAGKAKSTRSGD